MYSYEGKKSALAAASISKDCPYQHQGVLFHAEVSTIPLSICINHYYDSSDYLHSITFLSQSDFKEFQESYIAFITSIIS